MVAAAQHSPPHPSFNLHRDPLLSISLLYYSATTLLTYPTTPARYRWPIPGLMQSLSIVQGEITLPGPIIATLPLVSLVGGSALPLAPCPRPLVHKTLVGSDARRHILPMPPLLFR